MSTNRILALGALALVLYLGFKYGLRAAFPRIEVGYETGITGRVTVTLQSQKEHTFFLNGRASPRYGFGEFVPAGPAANQPGTGQQAPLPKNLDWYLRKDDFVRKAPHTAVLTVQRGDSLTQWACPMPTP